MNEIKPRDAKETAAIGLVGKITGVISIVGTAAVAILAGINGTDWLKDNIALLLSGITGMVMSGFTCYIAVRRMRIDKAGVWLILAFILLATSGCMTRTRCQSIVAESITINLRVNDADTLAENAYPRSVQILSQDQQIEGGADTVASGNNTPIAPLSGDEVIKAITDALPAP